MHLGPPAVPPPPPRLNSARVDAYARVGCAVCLPAVLVVKRARPRDVVHVHLTRALRHGRPTPARPRVRPFAVQLGCPRERLDVHHDVLPRRRRHARRRSSLARARGSGDVWHHALTRPVEHGLRQHVSEEAPRLRRRARQVASDDVSYGAGALVNVAARQARRLQLQPVAVADPPSRQCRGAVGDGAGGASKGPLLSTRPENRTLPTHHEMVTTH